MRGRPRRGLLAPAVLALLLLAAALMPVPTVDAAPAWSDLAVHALLYGLLAFALLRAGRLRGWRRPALTAVVGAIAYGALTELAQALVPHRSAAPIDVVADTVGALVAVGLAQALRRRRTSAEGRVTA